MLDEREFATYRALYHAMTESVLLPAYCVRIVVEPKVAAQRIQRRAAVETGRSSEAAKVDLDYLRALDNEIEYMTGVLERMGVRVEHFAWDMDRDTAEHRAQAVGGLAARIARFEPADFFLDLHRRTA